ncbi:MAG TPA: hypothetical protein ENG98_00235 [Actinobacteria bacterium]|nr:hypothetical protein BMS3Bbin01_02028 [bacterium BMS3Bbin01]HDL41424.1 hypothetical protein [Actinomycetota bacterium]
MTVADLIPERGLASVNVGISVSDSADLARLGLSHRHAEMAVGEVARSVLIGGGHLVYGGRVKPSGFTQFLMHEVRRYGGEQSALTLCLAAPEHRRLSWDELDQLDRDIGTKGRVICLDISGVPIRDILDHKPVDPDPIEDAPSIQTSYSSLRRFLGEITDARVLIGGQLSEFKGEMPGIIEEAIVAVQRGQPLYVSAGFGGAAALVAKTLGIDDLGWAPSDFPTRPRNEQIDSAIRQLRAAARDTGWDPGTCGLAELEREQLAASHRASEIASLVVVGLARAAT